MLKYLYIISFAGKCMETERTNLRELLERDGRLVYTCRGVSMLPLLRQKRDLMVIEKKTDRRCKRLDAVLFVRPNGQYVLHRILKVYDDGYWIVGDNCIGGENVSEKQVIGILKGVQRGKRYLDCEGRLCRLYAHLWGDVYPVRFIIQRLWRFAKRCLRFLKRKLFVTRKK